MCCSLNLLALKMKTKTKFKLKNESTETKIKRKYLRKCKMNENEYTIPLTKTKIETKIQHCLVSILELGCVTVIKFGIHVELVEIRIRVVEILARAFQQRLRS